MTDATQLAALEAVASAARGWLNAVFGLPYQTVEEEASMSVCERALIALDALPSAPVPAVEAVELGVWADDNGIVHLYLKDSPEDVVGAVRWRRLGTVTLRVATGGGP